MTNKTQPTSVDPREYIAEVKNTTRRRDAESLLEIYNQITKEPPIMWGPSMIGYGEYHYKYASGREGNFFKGGFAPRAANMVVYLMRGVKTYETTLKSLGPYKIGSSCLYLGSFEKLEISALRSAITEDWQWMTEKYG